jgi:hypothetical protein
MPLTYLPNAADLALARCVVPFGPCAGRYSHRQFRRGWISMYGVLQPYVFTDPTRFPPSPNPSATPPPTCAPDDICCAVEHGPWPVTRRVHSVLVSTRMSSRPRALPHFHTIPFRLLSLSCPPIHSPPSNASSFLLSHCPVTSDVRTPASRTPAFDLPAILRINAKS